MTNFDSNGTKSSANIRSINLGVLSSKIFRKRGTLNRRPSIICSLHTYGVLWDWLMCCQLYFTKSIRASLWLTLKLLRLCLKKEKFMITEVKSKWYHLLKQRKTREYIIFYPERGFLLTRILNILAFSLVFCSFLRQVVFEIHLLVLQEQDARY